MNFTSLTGAAACLFLVSLLPAQNSLLPAPSVSLYQLIHKPARQARSLFDKAMLEIRRQNYRASLSLLQKALDADPDYWQAQNNLGFVLLRLSDQVEAERAFKRAVEIDPTNAVGWTNLSIAAFNQKKYPLAEKSAAEAVRRNPRMPEAKAILGLAMVGQGNWTPEARKLLEESRTVTTSNLILKHWPRSNDEPPEVTVLTSSSCGCYKRPLAQAACSH